MASGANPDRTLEDDVGMSPRRQVPTLLIGLGGVGGRIVERIYERIPARERNRVATHIFDTDIGDLGKRKLFATSDRRTAMGTSLLVSELRAYYPEVDAWLPQGGRQFDHRSTINGAGQIRALSRLSLKHTLRTSRATNLIAAMHQLNLLSTHAQDVGVNPPPRVWLFCSLAGGTGAGAFISVALLARRLVQQMIAAPGGFTVNGVFVLPDVLTRTNKKIPHQNWESMRANAQASLRELEAINASLSGLVDPLRLELTEDGADGPVEVNPIDYAYLFDYANEKDQYLANEEAYIEQVARSMHLLLFDHIGDNATSAADNNIRAEIGKDHEARYVAPASSSLVFPRQDVTAFLTARWGAAQIHDQWLAVDHAYAVEHAKWKKDLKNHKLRPEPNRRERFMSDLMHRSEAKIASAPFFRSLVRQAHVAGQDGALGSPRGRAWVQSVEHEVKRRVERHAPSPLPIDRLLLRTEGGLRQQIETAELRLRSARREIIDFAAKHARMWAAECTTDDFGHDNVAKGSGEHRLNYWVFDGDHAIHPLAVRYVLYDALGGLDEKLANLPARNESRRSQLMAYESRWDDKTTPEVVENVGHHIEAALRGGLLGLGRRRTIDRLAEDYEKRSTGQHSLLVEYLEQRTLEEVLTEIRQEVATFAEAWEVFFAGLETVRDRMEEEQERARRRLDTNEGSPVRRVLASEAGREALWARLEERASDEEPADVSSATYRMLYARHCSRNERTASNVFAAFRAELTDTLATLIERMAVLPDGIGDALALQANLVGKEPAAHAIEELELVEGLAEPWVQTRATPRLNVSELFYWGIHPAEAGRLDRPVKDYLGIDHSAVDHGYDRDEIIYFKVPYLLRAADLFTFTPGVDAPNVPKVDGTYYAAFEKHQRKVLQGQITVHLDKRWDQTLPDFWDEGVPVRQMLIQGLALDLIEAHDGRWQVTVDADKGKQTVLLGDATGTAKLRTLMDNLGRSGRLREIGQLVKARMAEEIAAGQREHTPLHRHAFTRRVRAGVRGESLFLLVGDSYFGSAGEDSTLRERLTQALFIDLCEAVRRYAQAAIGDRKAAAHGTWLVVRGGVEQIEGTLGTRRSPRYPKTLLSNLRGIANEYRS